MAKQRGPVASTFSGRVGNVVGAKLKGGEYITRSYQPAVKNPNTLRQRVSRLRMSTAAKLAAGLAPAIQAGYGKAAGNTKMYPRNMFVRNLVKFSATSPLNIDGEMANLQYNDLKISARIGISTTPIIGAMDTETPLTIKASITGQPVVDVLPAGKMGVVLVAYDAESNTCVIDMFDAPSSGSTNLQMTVPSSWQGKNAYVYAFYKWVPESGNDIATNAEPWKYPAETSATVYIGTAIIG